MAHILAVDDDERILQAIKVILEGQGHQLTLARSGTEALRLLEASPFDLCIIDLIMPDMDGLSLIRRIRAMPFLARILILVLTAKMRAADTAEGLDAGADDYLKKPFEIVELPARIRALLRRAPRGVLDTSHDELVVGELCLHIHRPEVRVSGTLVELTTREHQLLYYLMRHPGQPVSTERLLEEIWAYPPGVGSPNIIQVHIANLKAKLAHVSERRFIRNLRGQGYMITSQP